MVTTSWFITAVEARNNIVKDIAVHSEITGIEREILFAVQRGDYEVDVTDNTLITESSPDPVIPFTVDPVTDTLTISSHPFRTGDAVVVSSTGELPPPLLSTKYYYVIYINPDTIKLATSKANAASGQPISIDFGQGVTTVAVSDPGSGYLSPPTIGFVGGQPTIPATAKAVLQSSGPVAIVSLLTSGSGYTDIPNASFFTVGNGAVLGPCTFKAVSATVLFGGSGYNLNDLIYIIGGTGTAFSAKATGVNGGAVTSISVIFAGNYSVLPTLSGAITTSSGTGSGCQFTLSMGISSISISNGGIQYVNPPLVSIGGGGGANATATTLISGGAVVNVVITNPGSGFTGQPTVQAIAGSGATASVRLVPTTVTTVALTNNGGATYTSVPNVSIQALGSGATVFSISMLTVGAFLVNAGVGYTQGDQLLASGGIGLASTQIQVLTTDSQGRILTWNIVNPGIYTALPQLQSNNFVGGNGLGASWTLSMGVKSVTLASGGSGYITSPLVVFTSGGGAGAAGYATITVGAVSQIIITDNGANYTSVPIATISGGSGATAQAQLTPTGVNTITVVDPGSGYVTAPEVTISGGGGIGALAVADLIGDVIDTITVIDPGSGYTSAPSVTIEGNAVGTANIIPTTLQSISVIANGTGYTHVPSVIVAGAATAVARMAPTGILSVDIINGGTNYVSDPLLLLGFGAGQIGTPVTPISNTNRSFSIAMIQVLESGDEYQTIPSVTISAPDISTGILAVAVASLGSGTGNFSLTQYEASRDYYKVWKNQSPSSELLVRPMADQMNAVIKYFTDLGYTINRYTNTSTGNTISWNVKW